MPLPTDPAANLAALIRCPSVTPAEGGALGALGAMLEPLGFAVERPVFSESGTTDVENLYARRSDGAGPHLMFAGHTDVVPPGDESLWTHPPFSAAVADGQMWGRGAVDMKGGVACFVAAAARFLERSGAFPGAVSLLVTGDEEGPAVNGTAKLLQWAADRGERWDGAVVGEPTNASELGDTIKVGRRGSLSGEIVVKGRQGHAAYPQLADNPVRGLLALIDALLDPPLDRGTEHFQPSNLEVTTIDVGNPATNVIPAAARALFNIRFNDRWSADGLKAEIGARLDRAAAAGGRFRETRAEPVRFELAWREPPSGVFLTRDERLVGLMGDAVEAVTGRRPALTTGGGTSDARFVKDFCPVLEFGLVGTTMHMVDERVPLAELEALTRVYERFLEGWFRT